MSDDGTMATGAPNETRNAEPNYTAHRASRFALVDSHIRPIS
jgi:hypothetical protein